jgi:hypothetical protein
MIRSTNIGRILSVIAVVVVMATAIAGLAPNASASPDLVEPCQEEYVVQADDWLSKLAEEYLGDASAYPFIYAATIAQSAVDSRFAHIDDPNQVDVGWLLCIPPVEVTVPVIVTDVETFVPAIPDGEPQKGTCPSSSRVLARADAWHCNMESGDIYDPCFSVTDDAGEVVVVCGADPVYDDEYQYTQPLKVALTEPLPTPDIPESSKALADANGWKLVLENGATCRFTALAAPATAGGKDATFKCQGFDKPHWILGNLQQGEVWTAEVAEIGTGAELLDVLDTRVMAIRSLYR